MSSRDLSRSKCLVIAVGSVLTAMLLRTLIYLVVDERVPYSTFYLAVIVTSLYCGLRWGLVATALSLAASSFWLVPLGEPLITEMEDLARALMFLLVSLLTVWLADRVWRHRRDAERSAEERQMLLVREQAARKEAERANRAKDEFLATVSHELRTPLQSILGWTQLLQLDGIDSEQARIALGSIERSVKVQSQLINDLLDLSRIVMGKLRLDMRAVALADVVTAALETVCPAAKAKSIELVSEIHEGSAGVLGDPDRLHQVVWNLLSNAIKFTPHGGRIRLSVVDRGRTVELTVADDGEGIEPELLTQVFERFQQTESGQRKGGLGLGLAIVKELVELHGGSVRVFSAGRGRGTSFTVTLPGYRVPAISTEQPEFDSGNHVPASFSQRLTGRRILVVEDDPAAAAAIHRVLERHGARVIAAGSAEQARDLLKSERPDVLLSDLGMPGEDGLQMIQSLRRHREKRLAHIPAVALTARVGKEDRLRALASGFQAHLGKPITSGDLVSTLEQFSGREENA